MSLHSAKLINFNFRPRPKLGLRMKLWSQSLVSMSLWSQRKT